MDQYPQPIQEIVKDAMEDLQIFIYQENIRPDILQDALCESLMKKFVMGEELRWEIEEFEEILKLSVVNTIIEELKDKGYIDSIEDENGKEWMWATEKAKKELANHFPKEDK